MVFPFLYCDECGWVPSGKQWEIALSLADREIKRRHTESDKLCTVLVEELNMTEAREARYHRQLRRSSEREREDGVDRVVKRFPSRVWFKPVLGIILTGILLMVLLLPFADSGAGNILAAVGIITFFTALMAAAVYAVYSTREK
ncbi:MAG: hypothetical protein ACMUHB_01745 [Thermoplasmatota archaeon]